MARLIWTEPALRDLDEIAEYISLDNVGAAKKLVARVFRSVERLLEHPESGRKPPEMEMTSVREVIVPPCRIFYRIDDERVYILHIMRGERQLRSYLIDERKNRTNG